MKPTGKCFQVTQLFLWYKTTAESITLNVLEPTMVKNLAKNGTITIEEI